MATITLYKQELKGRILTFAMCEFRKQGIRNVKMDDIAHLLGISKRTLYEIYPDKESLLFDVVKEHEAYKEERMNNEKINGSGNVMDVVIKFYKMLVEDLRDVNPLFFTELGKYPRVVNYLSERHRERETESYEFFRLGVAQGYFRGDVDYGIITQVCNVTMKNVMKDEFYRNCSMEHIFKNVIILLIRGFCTPKGLEKLDDM